MIINLLGYQIMIFKKSIKVPTIGNAVKVATNGTWLFLCDQQGEQLPGQIACTLHERLNAPPYATVELVVNIDELLSKGKTI